MFTRQTEQTRQLRLSISQTPNNTMWHHPKFWYIRLIGIFKLNAQWFAPNLYIIFGIAWIWTWIHEAVITWHSGHHWLELKVSKQSGTYKYMEQVWLKDEQRQGKPKIIQCLTDCQSEFLSKIMHVWIDLSCYLFVQAAMLERQMKNKTCYQVVKYIKESNNNGISLLLAVNPFRYPKINIPIRHPNALKYTTKFQVLTTASRHLPEIRLSKE